MSLSKQSRENLLDAILSIADTFGKSETSIVTDLFFQADKPNGVIVIFNDSDEELARAEITEWKDASQEHGISIEKALRSELTQMQKVGLLDKTNILKPYSCTLVDEKKEAIVDLIYIDDDTMILDTELLKGFDKEMEEFLERLLGDLNQ